MMRPLGHDRVLAALEETLPPVTLLFGPKSVGKATVADYLAWHHGVLPTELKRCPAPLRVDDVRSVIAFVATMVQGPFKLTIAELDDASDSALNALLKTLEEPPPMMRFILTASKLVLPTIMSRAAVYAMGPLPREDLVTILVNHGMSESNAVKAAALGRGQVDVALGYGSTEAARSTVLTLIRAIAQHDLELFDTTAKSVDDITRQLLVRFCVEALTQNWAMFSPSDAYTIEGATFRRILGALNQIPRARPRLQIRTVLRPLVAPT